MKLKIDEDLVELFKQYYVELREEYSTPENIAATVASNLVNAHLTKLQMFGYCRIENGVVTYFNKEHEAVQSVEITCGDTEVSTASTVKPAVVPFVPTTIRNAPGSKLNPIDSEGFTTQERLARDADHERGIAFEKDLFGETEGGKVDYPLPKPGALKVSGQGQDAK